MSGGITAFIIVTIGANLVLSLGMVGALSIVRFRAAIKEPLDIGFLYWSISAGLTAGARLYPVAIIGTLSVGLIYIIMIFLRKEKRSFLLILHYNSASEDAVSKILNQMRYKLKNKTFVNDQIELTLDIKVVKNNTDFIHKFTATDFISKAMLVEYNGDYT